jgi:hypothetical protein
VPAKNSETSMTDPRLVGCRDALRGARQQPRSGAGHDRRLCEQQLAR